MHHGCIRVGTSGWSYPHWARDRFYPSGLRQADWLRFYAERFSTVEVNMTFYRLPSAALVSRWGDATPPHFQFAVKLWRRITHDKRLADCEDELRRAVDAVRGLGAKRGPLLVQLPPSMTCDVARLDAFFDRLDECSRDLPWRVAVEFRNKDWLQETVYEVLNRRGAALCVADMPRCEITEPNDAEFVYVRRHGPGGRYRGCYAPQDVQNDAERARAWSAEGRDVYVYYNNDVEGHAIDNARQLWEQTQSVSS